jgi:hypothetical protein
MSIFGSTKRVTRQVLNDNAELHGGGLNKSVGPAPLSEVARLRSKVVAQRRELRRINKALEQRAAMLGKYVDTKNRNAYLEQQNALAEASLNDARATVDQLVARTDNAAVINLAGKRYFLVEA